MAQLLITITVFAFPRCFGAPRARLNPPHSLVGGHPKLAGEPASAKVKTKAGPSDAVDLTEKQVASIKVEPAGEHLFSIEKGAVGNID
jgi:hypothetical protein